MDIATKQDLFDVYLDMEDTPTNYKSLVMTAMRRLNTLSDENLKAFAEGRVVFLPEDNVRAAKDEDIKVNPEDLKDGEMLWWRYTDSKLIEIQMGFLLREKEMYVNWNGEKHRVGVGDLFKKIPYGYCAEIIRYNDYDHS